MSWVNLISVASLPLSMAVVGVVLKLWSLTAVAGACASVLAVLAIVAAAFGGVLDNT
jgi:hypothetical protein